MVLIFQCLSIKTFEEGQENTKKVRNREKQGKKKKYKKFLVKLYYERRLLFITNILFYIIKDFTNTYIFMYFYIIKSCFC